MIVGGFQRFSLIDYPGKISASIFTRGCNFRCGYCHNPELVLPERYSEAISLTEIYDFLDRRKGKLDAVVISGGEPTDQPDLVPVIKKIKSMGFLVKIDTNGTRPDVLQELIKSELINYISMDVKAPIGSYKKVVGYEPDSKLIKESIDLTIRSGLDHEFRTTLVKGLIDEKEIIKIAEVIKGAQKYYLQIFSPTKCIDSNFLEREVYSEKELESVVLKIKDNFGYCGAR